MSWRLLFFTKDFGSAEDMSMVFVLSAVPPVPAHSYFTFTPLTLRVRTAEPSGLLQEILAFFRGMTSGELKVNPTKCTIRAELILNYRACVSKARLFGSGDIVLIEFQRQSGCSLTNGSVYLGAQRHLILGGYQLENPSPMLWANPPPPPLLERWDEVDISTVWQMTETEHEREEGALILWKLVGEGVNVFRHPEVVDRCLQLLASPGSFGTRYAAARLLRAHSELQFGLSALYSRPARALLAAAAAAPPASVGSQLESLAALIDRRWQAFGRLISTLAGNHAACVITGFLLG